MSDTGYVKVDKEIVLRACSNFERGFDKYKKIVEDDVIVEMSYLIRGLKWFHKTPNLNKIQEDVDKEVSKRLNENYWYTIYLQVKELAQLGNVLYLNVYQAEFVNKFKELQI